MITMLNLLHVLSWAPTPPWQLTPVVQSISPTPVPPFCLNNQHQMAYQSPQLAVIPCTVSLKGIYHSTSHEQLLNVIVFPTSMHHFYQLAKPVIQTVRLSSIEERSVRLVQSIDTSAADRTPSRLSNFQAGRTQRHDLHWPTRPLPFYLQSRQQLHLCLVRLWHQRNPSSTYQKQTNRPSHCWIY